MRQVFNEVDKIEKILKDMSNTSDFAERHRDETKATLHERAVNICRALAKIQTEDVRGYKLRMMAVLSKIEAMTR